MGLIYYVNAVGKGNSVLLLCGKRFAAERRGNSCKSHYKQNVAVMTSARTLYAARNSMQYIKKLLQTSLVFAIMAKSLV